MGNKQANPTSKSDKPPAKNQLADSSDEEDDKEQDIEPQAEVFIQLIVVHELPHGSTSDHVLTVDPNKLVIQIKEDLEHILHIPREDIQIYRHQNPQTEMPNNSTLHELVVLDNKQLRVRDRRAVYSKPIIVKE